MKTKISEVGDNYRSEGFEDDVIEYYTFADENHHRTSVDTAVFVDPDETLHDSLTIMWEDTRGKRDGHELNLTMDEARRLAYRILHYSEKYAEQVYKQKYNNEED